MYNSIRQQLIAHFKLRIQNGIAGLLVIFLCLRKDRVAWETVTVMAEDCWESLVGQGWRPE